MPSLIPKSIPNSLKFKNLSSINKKLKRQFDKLKIKVPHYHYNMKTVKNYMKTYNKEKTILKDPFVPKFEK